MSQLILSDIDKNYGSNVALRDVSLQIDSGEFICLLGASGCGKTTLLRIIAGLESHDHGDIRLDANDLSGVPCHQRNIGMVFQSLALFPHLNVGQNISYGLKMRSAKPDVMAGRVNQLLAMVGLPAFGNRAVASLSGGQRQRVAIARALALEPQLFLMDEPFSALDAGLRDHLQQEVKKLQQRLAVTTIFVTHDQREAMALADRIVVLNDGRIEQVGTPAQIYQQPGSRFVAQFIGSNNLLDVDIDANDVRFNHCSLGPPPSAFQHLLGKQTLTIRPEAVVLNTTDTSDPPLQGNVIMRRPVGATVEHKIDVNGTVIKQTSLQNSAGNVSVGDEVSLSWDWSQVWMLPGEA